MNRHRVSQAMHPAGVRGRIFATLMEWLKTPAYRRAVALIDPAPNDTLLEIGFGTGALLSMLAPRVPGGLLAGVDPSALMVHQARRRLIKFATRVRVDLRCGSDREIHWPVGHFSHVVALHSFQFWPEPELTLRKIKTVMRPGAKLILILRSHRRHKPEWLPNPISRSADEVEGTVAALEMAGLHHVRRLADVGSSAVIMAGL
jgi:ubiquinone/menaquinone biosynthesis C-methylase UbiE